MSNNFIIQPLKESTEVLKTEYIKYFEDVPIQKYAAMFIGKDEDTIIRWKKLDTNFADSIQVAKAKWIRKKLISTKAEFALEKLVGEIFSKDTSKVEISAYERRLSIIQQDKVDPNSPSNKALNEKILKVLMEHTKVPSEVVK